MRTKLWLAVLPAFVLATKVSAQKEPDMRAIAPFVMIVADTSGSMEYRPDRQCTSGGGCTDAYPTCDATNNSSGVPPVGKRNRWALLLESLTGTFTDFQCVPQARTDGAHFGYDVGYALPYHRPWACKNGDPYCAYPGTIDGSPIQVQNGLLDNYASRIRFGLATFDGMRTYTGAGDLVTSFNDARSEGLEGSYSFGGKMPVRYPTCAQTHYIDSGIRGPNAPEGGLISLQANLCPSPPCDPAVVSAEIQKRLLATRPFGGTPTASALDDLYYHFKNELNDTMASCRERYAILITDGYPDDDFREYPVPGCDCVARKNCPPGDDMGMSCPYPTAEKAASNLKHGKSTQTTTDPPQLDKLFVVGMSIADNASREGLNRIASEGGSIDTDGDGNEAFFADDPSTLTATLDGLLGDLTKPISRSVPAFATGLSGMQYQVSAGFTISPETPPPGFAPPWKGILERRRFMCNELGIVSVPSLSDDDKFDVQLNNRPGRERRLWTSLPPNPQPSDLVTRIDRIDPGTKCGLTGCPETPLRDVPLNLLGGIDADRKLVLMGWMYGEDGSLRANKKLGDIYHSSPAIVGPPVADPGDQSYTLFRESTLVEERPMMMYVNSNDGILHAFVLEDHRIGSVSYKGGTELWGFVPPVLLKDLDKQLSAHRLNLDATPVVKDVYFKKTSQVSATDYKTVLITGMRSGGNAYVALDVTDPPNPKFMWQFTDEDMGETYGQPLIVQARYQWPANQPASLRAMAILPGGKGTQELNAGLGCNVTNRTTESYRQPGGGRVQYAAKVSPTKEANNTLVMRPDVPCWGRKGRALYFVDVETGQLIKKLFDDDSSTSNGTIFPSPLVGSPTAYQDAVGMTATEGFVLDADGVLWRIDLTSQDQRKDDPLGGWQVRPFHDLFWDMGPFEGETTYERPILSLDDKHQLVVIVGTGDTDNFEKNTVKNRVVSLTEVTINATPQRPDDYVAGMNWELRSDVDSSPGFVTSELVTGTMALFAQQLFIASFISLGDTANPCSAGLGRLWSVHFNQWDTALRNSTNRSNVITYGPLRIPVVSSDTSGASSDLTLFNIPKSKAEPNLLVLGLGSTQRITCDVTETQVGNYYQPGNTVANIKQQTQPSIWIVAQASSDNKTRTRAGSKLGTLEVQLSRPLEFSQVSSWAGSIE